MSFYCNRSKCVNNDTCVLHVRQLADWEVIDNEISSFPPAPPFVANPGETFGPGPTDIDFKLHKRESSLEYAEEDTKARFDSTIRNIDASHAEVFPHIRVGSLPPAVAVADDDSAPIDVPIIKKHISLPKNILLNLDSDLTFGEDDCLTGESNDTLAINTARAVNALIGAVNSISHNLTCSLNREKYLITHNHVIGNVLQDLTENISVLSTHLDGLSNEVYSLKDKVNA